MKKINTFIYLFFISLMFLFFHNTYGADDEKKDSYFSVDRIRKELPKYIDVSNKALGKEITVFLGNTGVGKSMLVDALFGFPLRVNIDGEVVLDGDYNDYPNASLIKEGGDSITRHPKYFFSEHFGNYDGFCHVFDLPGFKDTEGTVQDFLNASAIHRVLKNANKVSAVLMTSQAELQACRGKLSKDFNRSISMFSDQFLQSSCIMIVNIVDQEKVDDPEQINGIKKSIDTLIENSKKIDQNNIIFLRKARYGDDCEGFFRSMIETVNSKLISVNKEPLGELKISYIFPQETNNQIEQFIIDSMEKLMKENRDSRYENIFLENLELKKDRLWSDYLKENKQKIQNKIWNKFKDEVKLTQEYELFCEICPEQYPLAFGKFEPYFFREHIEIFHQIEIKEKEEEQEKAKKLAELYQKEKEDAENQEKLAKILAEKAQEDATKSKEGKELANQEVIIAHNKLKEAEDNYNRSLKEAKNREEILKKAKEEQEKRIEQERKDMKVKMGNLEKKLASLEKDSPRYNLLFDQIGRLGEQIREIEERRQGPFSAMGSLIDNTLIRCTIS